MFELVLMVAALLCGLVAGVLFAYAVVAMPGIATLDDREFLRSFQVMDRVIQNNQPLFLLAWVGSVLAVILAVVAGLGETDGMTQLLLILALAVYLLGVQLPTAIVNIPLNNRLQNLDIDTADRAQLQDERDGFEGRWNRWNRIRTALAIITTALLLVVLAMV